MSTPHTYKVGDPVELVQDDFYVGNRGVHVNYGTVIKITPKQIVVMNQHGNEQRHNLDGSTIGIADKMCLSRIIPSTRNGPHTQAESLNVFLAEMRRVDEQFRRTKDTARQINDRAEALRTLVRHLSQFNAHPTVLTPLTEAALQLHAIGVTKLTFL
jgi:hypothetical protein